MTEEMTNPSSEHTLSLADLPMRLDRSPGYQKLVSAGPVVWIDNGVHMVVSREAAREALLKTEVFSSRGVSSAALGSSVPLIHIDFDPPEQTEYRRILRPFFDRSVVEGLSDPLREQVNALIDEFIERGRCDVFHDLATPFPARTFLTFFGLPLEDERKLTTWKDVIIGGADAGSSTPPETVQKATQDLLAYLRAHMAERADRTGDDVLTRLVTSQEGERLNDEEILGLCFLFVIAGLDTVTATITTAFARLAKDPELRRRLTDDPSLIPSAVEEFVRLDPPAPHLPRFTTREVEIAGHVIPAGARVIIAVGAANHDTDDADAFQFGRTEGHLGFGYGPHFCLGARLARLELATVLREWHRRIPEYGLAPDADLSVAWPSSVVEVRNLVLTFPSVGAAGSPAAPTGG